MSSNIRRKAALLVAAMAAYTHNAPSQAASASWAAAASGSWNSAANWSPATIPNGAGDNATISIGGSYTVTLNSNQTVNTLAQSASSATLNHSSGTLTASAINISNGTYSLAGGVISGGIITVSGGGTFVASSSGNNRLVNSASLAGDLVVNGGQLRFESGAAFTGGNATLSSNSVVGWQQTNTLSGKSIFLSGNSTFAVEGTNTLTLATTTTVTGGSANIGRVFNIAGTSTLINSGTLSASVAGQTLTVNPLRLINDGTLLANTGVLTIDHGGVGSFSNLGTVRAVGGGVVGVQRFSNSSWTNTATGVVSVADGSSSVILAGNWNNLGTFAINGGTLSLEGTFSRAGIGTITRTGGTLNIAGFLDNTGGTLTLNASTGDFRMFGGTINGGTIASAGATLEFGPSGGNRFINNATLLGDLATNNGQIRFESGATFTGGNATLSSNSVVGWQQTNTLSGKSIFLSGNTTFAVEGTNTLTIGATTMVRGAAANMGRVFNVGGSSTLINAGTLLADSSGQTFTLNPGLLINTSGIFANPGILAIDQGGAGSFSNQGLLRAAGGGILSIQRFSSSSWSNAAGATLEVADAASTAILAGNWNNLGTFILNGGTLSLEGTFTRSSVGTINRTGGTVNLSGFLDNSGGTLTLTGTTGDYRLQGGIISGGTIVNAGGNLVFGASGSNRLINSATLAGDLITSAGQVRFESGSTFTGANATLTSNTVVGWQQTNTLSGKSISLTGSTLAVEGTNTLTLASSTTVRGSGSNFGQTFNIGGTSTVMNGGTIQSFTAGQGFNINPGVLINTGTIIASPGNITITAGSFSNQGRVRASGASLAILQFTNGTWVNTAAGTIEVADATASATLAGNWSNLGNVTLNAGTLNLEGTFSRAGIGTISRTGGTINVTGFLDNSGGTLTLNAATGDYRMLGGTITAGTIAQAGANLVFGQAGGNRLINNAVLTGNLVVSSGSARFESGATFTGGNATLNNAVLGWQQSNTISGKTFNVSGSTFAVEGTNTLTLAATTTVRGGNSAVGRTFNIAGTSTLINAGTISADTAAQIITVNPNFLTNTGTLEATNGGRLTLGPTTDLGSNPGRLRADGPGSVVQIPGGSYTINQAPVITNHGLIYFQGTYTKAVTFNVGGRVVFDYSGASPFNTIRSEIISGYAGGLWNGPGINSSAAAAAAATGLGYAEASAVLGPTGGQFAGVSVDGTAILVRYTLHGDASLDGAVNLDDFTRLAAAFGTSSNWAGGDSNYDGVTNLDDFTALAANFGLSLPADAPRSTVPEPAEGLAAIALLRIGRRRDRRI